MLRQPILVAVDTSPAAANAAEFGVRLARAMDVPCILVHAVRDPWATAFLAEVPQHAAEFTRTLYAEARERLTAQLAPRFPAGSLPELIVQAGRPADVIADIARESHAGLIVLGGKHHSALDRWLGGSTALNVARTTTVPMLVTAGTTGGLSRILAALDTSGAAGPTLEVARQLAQSLGAKLRAIVAIEPLPVMPESAPVVDPTPYYDLCRSTIDAELRARVADAGGELVVHEGTTATVIETEAASWRADLVVMGSHGKNWTQRLMLGSVTERLLNDLPTSLAVVPVTARAPAAVPAAPMLVPAIG